MIQNYFIKRFNKYNKSTTELPKLFNWRTENIKFKKILNINKNLYINKSVWHNTFYAFQMQPPTIQLVTCNRMFIQLEK